MVFVTYQMSNAVEPRQFMDSELCGEGRAYNNVIMFSAARKGDFRVSLVDYYGVMYFHVGGQLDIEINNIPHEVLGDMLRDIATTFFVTLKLTQPIGPYPELPMDVKPNEPKAQKVM